MQPPIGERPRVELVRWLRLGCRDTYCPSERCARMTLAANLATPPHLNGQTAALLVIPIFVLILGWIIALVVRILRTS